MEYLIRVSLARASFLAAFGRPLQETFPPLLLAVLPVSSAMHRREHAEHESKRERTHHRPSKLPVRFQHSVAASGKRSHVEDRMEHYVRETLIKYPLEQSFL